MGIAQGEVGLAFAMVTCAGLATAVGAALVFWKRFVDVASAKMLAGSLGVRSNRSFIVFDGVVVVIAVVGLLLCSCSTL